MANVKALQAYLQQHEQVNEAMVAYTAALQQIADVDTAIAARIVNEFA